MAVISENKVDIDFILDWISDWTHGVSCEHKSHKIPPPHLNFERLRNFHYRFNNISAKMFPKIIFTNQVEKLLHEGNSC